MASSIFEPRLSSREDLSPMEAYFDDTESIYSSKIDELDEDDAIEAYPKEDWKASMMATVVSIIHVGRPKVIDVLPSPSTSPTTSFPPSRDSSITNVDANHAPPRILIRHASVAILKNLVERARRR